MNHFEAAILSADSYRPFDSKKPNSNYKRSLKEGWEYLSCSDEL